jgi:hypothetical protein
MTFTNGYNKGDLIRLLVPLASGWQGIGVIARDVSFDDDENTVIAFHKFGEKFNDTPNIACANEVEFFKTATIANASIPFEKMTIACTEENDGGMCITFDWDETDPELSEWTSWGEKTQTAFIIKSLRSTLDSFVDDELTKPID